jgi:chromosome segregation ATPase
MPTPQEIKQQQEKLDEILKQQEIVADSVKRYKIQQEELNKETAKITKSNADLSLTTGDIQNNIDFLSGHLEKRKKEVKDFEESYKVKFDRLSVIDQEIEQKNLSLTEMEKESTERIRKEVVSLQSDIDKLSTQRDNLIIEITDKTKQVDRLNETVGVINDSITILKSQEKDQKNVVDNETVNINELTKTVDKLKDQIESYTNVLDVLKNDIKEGQTELAGFEETRSALITEIKKLTKDRDFAQGEFDELSLKSRILIERGEYQDGQAVWLKEQFEKIGRDYQPYQP